MNKQAFTFLHVNVRSFFKIKTFKFQTVMRDCLPNSRPEQLHVIIRVRKLLVISQGSVATHIRGMVDL